MKYYGCEKVHKLLLAVIAFILIGCGEEKMTIGIPVESILVSTSVPYDIDEYNPDYFYEEKTKVRKDDKIYDAISTGNIAVESYESGKYYSENTVVQDNNLFYKKQPDTIAAFYIPGNAAPKNYEFRKIVDWHESNVEYYYLKIPELNVEKSLRYTFNENIPQGTSLYRSFNVEIFNVLNGDVFVGTYNVYNSIYDAPVGSYVVLGGSLCYVYGLTNENLTETDKWKVVNNYDDGFNTVLAYLRPSVKMMPFDPKSYTSVVISGDQNWKLKALGRFNSISLGNLRADHVIVVVKDDSNSTLKWVEKRIDGTIDENLEEEAISDIIYLDEWFLTGTHIEIYINGQETEIGNIILTASIDSGMTNLKFKHSVKDFSRTQISEISGYIEYIAGNKIVVYEGSYQIETKYYDRQLRLDKKLTGELIAVDGSDMLDNSLADGENTFQSTIMICRVELLEMESEEESNSVSKTSQVDFRFEEVV